MKSIGQIFTFSILKTFTEIFFLTFCLLFPYLQLLGQVSENFDDNELNQNPLWVGNIQDFQVASGALQLNAPPVSGTSAIVTENKAVTDAIWQIKVSMAFNPSSSNYCRIYLMSDTDDLNGPLNGYFVMIGNAGDEVSLYRQDGSMKTKIVDGLDGRINAEQVNLTIRVSRSSSGEWELLTDTSGDGIYISEGTIRDAAHEISLWTGIQCVYTSTRSNKFSFDDFSVTVAPDSTPPVITAVHVASENELLIEFSEPAEKSSAETVTNFFVDRGIGSPASVTTEPDTRRARLTFVDPFESGVPCHMTVSGIKDLAGNVMTQDTLTFLFVREIQPAYKDVIISELMADPTPAATLPEAEFVEVFNRSNAAFNLKGWSLSDGSTTGLIMDEVILLPKSFLILSSAAESEKFLLYGEASAVSTFPSLNNTGDILILRSREGILVDSIAFSDDWYGDTERNEGGFSIEIIDPENTCEGFGNWTATENPLGGTPGKENSVNAENPDLQGPALEYAYAVTADTIRVAFSEALSKQALTPENFILEGLPSITHVIQDRSLRNAYLVLSPALTVNEPLTFTMTGIFDCAGNELQEFSRAVTVVLPQPADSLDIVLNEVLFNPRSNGVDFIEIKNRSLKFVDLQGWAVSGYKDGVVSESKTISEQPIIIAPQGLLALTPSKSILQSEYPSSPERFIYEAEIPALRDDEGTIALLDEDKKIIDHSYYSEKMHSVFLQNTEGVSLERISAENPSNEESNWRSCNTILFATPGSVNSNSQTRVPLGETEIRVLPEIFIPGSGPDQYAMVEYQFHNAGYIGTIRIYDPQARLIKTLAENILLGTSGFFRWDGDRNDGSKAPIGPYLLAFEVFDHSGSSRLIRKRVVIAGKF
jgi:hypothetical protein